MIQKSKDGTRWRAGWAIALEDPDPTQRLTQSVLALEEGRTLAQARGLNTLFLRGRRDGTLDPITTGPLFAERAQTRAVIDQRATGYCPHQMRHATLSVSMPEIAATRLSSVTSSVVKLRMIRPWNIATIRSETCITSGISDEITITA